MHEQLKQIPFELKELSETGEFVGYAAIFGNVDLGNDVIEPGAFAKSIEVFGNKVRLMDGHKVRIGVAQVEETAVGLKAYGKINTAKQSGAEAYSDLKFYRDNGLPMQMSIGFLTVKADMPPMTKDGARHLRELRLFEVTITELPMNEKAQVLQVKSISEVIASIKAARVEQKDDFTTELQEIQLYSARYQMLQALSCALCDPIYDATMTPEQKVSASELAIQQFSAAYLAMLPEFLALMSSGMELMGLPDLEQKIGRMLSSANCTAIKECIKNLQELLDAADVKAVDPAPSETKSADPTGPAAVVTPPVEQGDNHSAIISKIDQLKEVFKPWNK